MPGRPLDPVVRHIRDLAGREATRHSTDADLVRRFVAQRDEAAFTALVRRHSGLVLGVCRRVLRQEQDAEDAFQATFLLLAQKAKSLRDAESVANWLYEVAHRMAMNAKRKAATRRTHEKRAAAQPRQEPPSDASLRELQLVLDEELARLPTRLRVPFLLCCLEGKSRSEAAHELGWKEGTVASRLAQARQRLQQRLIRRGITLSAVLCAAAVAEKATGAAVPAGLLNVTVQGALAFAAGQAQTAGLVSANVFGLVKGARHAMLFGKFKIATMVLLTIGLASGGVGTITHALLAQRAAEAGQQAEASEAPAEPQRAVVNGPQVDLDGDPLPPGAVMRLGSQRFREKGTIGPIAFSPDGKYLACGRDDGTIRLRDPGTGKVVKEIKGHTGRLAGLAFSGDGKMLASTGGKKIHLWHVATGKELWNMACEVEQAVAGGTSWAETAPVAFSPDHQLVAAGSADGSVHVYVVATGKERHKLAGGGKGIGCLAFTPDGKTLLWGCGDRQKAGVIRAWQVATGTEARTVAISVRGQTGGLETTRPYAFSPDGKTLAVEDLRMVRKKNDAGGFTVSVGCGLRLVSTRTGAECLKMSLLDRPIYGIAFSPNGRFLGFSGMDARAGIWDVQTGQKLLEVKGDGGTNRTGDDAQSLAFSHDSRTFACRLSGEAIRLWEVNRRRELWGDSRGHRSGVRHLVYAPDGKTLASAGQDIRMWETATGKPLATIPGHGGDTNSLAFSPDGKRLASAGIDGTVRVHRAAGTAGIDGTVQICRAADGKELHRFALPDIKIGESAWRTVSRSVNFSEDGRVLTAVGSDKLLRRWDVLTGKEIVTRPLAVVGVPEYSDRQKPEDFLKQIFTCQPGADERMALLASFESIHVVDAVSGQELYKLPGLRPGSHMSLSPDGKLLAASKSDLTVHFWELATGKEVRRLTVPGNAEAMAIAFAPDGRTVAMSVGWLDTAAIHVFDLPTRRELHKFRGHGTRVDTLAFSPDGRRLAGGQLDTTILIWDVSDVPDRRGPAKKLAAKDMEQLWNDLAAGEAARAHAAIWALVASPKEALALLAREKLPAVPKAKPERIEQLIRELDSGKFQKRQAASKELMRLDVEAEPALRKALEGSLPLEVRRRVEEVLTKRSPRKIQSAEELRRLRAIRALELIGTKPAREILERLADGAGGALETQDAKMALGRLRLRESLDLRH